MEKWWLCSHEGKGLPGCPLCDASIPSHIIPYLRAARVEIGRLNPLEDEKPPKVGPGDFIQILGRMSDPFFGRVAEVREDLSDQIFTLRLDSLGSSEPLDVTMYLKEYQILKKN